MLMTSAKVQNSALQCPTGTLTNPFSCSTESAHCWMRHKVVQELGSLPRLASWGQPAAQLLQGSHQSLLLNDHCRLSVAVCCCSEATKSNATSSGGGRGWSVARATAVITSKMLARFRALAQNHARGGGWRLDVDDGGCFERVHWSWIDCCHALVVTTDMSTAPVVVNQLIVQEKNPGGTLGTAQANPCCWLTPLNWFLIDQLPSSVQHPLGCCISMASQQSKRTDWTFHG